VHLDGRDDGLMTVAPFLERPGSVTTLIDTEPEEAALATTSRRADRTSARIE